MSADRLFDLEPEVAPVLVPVPGGRWGLQQQMPDGGWQAATVLCGYERREDAEADVAKLTAGGYRFRVFDRVMPWEDR